MTVPTPAARLTEPQSGTNDAPAGAAAVAEGGRAEHPPATVAQEPAGLRGAAGRRHVRPALRVLVRAGRRRHVRSRLLGGLSRQRRGRRGARPRPSVQEVQAGGSGPAAGAACRVAGRLPGVRRARGWPGDRRAAARRRGRRLPGDLFPVLGGAEARAGGRAGLRRFRLRPAGRRRRGGHARAAVRVVPAGLQPRRADGGDRQALYRAHRARRGLGEAPAGDAGLLCPGAQDRAARRFRHHGRLLCPVGFIGAARPDAGSGT